MGGHNRWLAWRSPETSWAEYAKLDKDVQVAVDAAVAKFARHPYPAQQMEKPQHSRDDRIRIMPVNGRWRGVVLAPVAQGLTAAFPPTAFPGSDSGHVLPGHGPAVH